MNIYLLTQTENTGYETFDSCVVVSTDEKAAKKIHPYALIYDEYGSLYLSKQWINSTAWASSPDLVSAKFIGVADSSFTQETIICTSFSAG